MTFPRTIKLNDQILTLCEEEESFSGLNIKKRYQDSQGDIYIMKIEKKRGLEVFDGLFGSVKPTREKLQIHLDLLRDEATAMTVIASRVAKKLFPWIQIPENYLSRLEDGTPIVLSKLIPTAYQFVEFLKLTKPVQEKKSTGWETLPTTETLGITESQAFLLGQIYYVALLMGHWDVVNNIDLTNSGSVNMDDTLYPCIVDWGNCPQGFGGLSQDACAFKNPEFKGLNLKTSDDPVTGFWGCVPFDGIVYPRLPRQVVPDLFDITEQDVLHKKMLDGFKMAHLIVEEIFNKELIMTAIAEVFSSPEACSFKRALNQELYSGMGLANILAKRLESLSEIIDHINKKQEILNISAIQFKSILESQHVKLA